MWFSPLTRRLAPIYVPILPAPEWQLPMSNDKDRDPPPHQPSAAIATMAILHLGIKEGDILLFDPGAEHPVTLVRQLSPNWGAFLGALTAGQLEDLTPQSGAASSAVAALLVAQRGAPPAASRPSSSPLPRAVGEDRE